MESSFRLGKKILQLDILHNDVYTFLFLPEECTIRFFEVAFYFSKYLRLKFFRVSLGNRAYNHKLIFHI